VAAADYLESVQELDRQRRELMKRYAADYRADLAEEVGAREARVALLAAKAASAAAIAERSRNISDGGYRSRDYHDDAKIRAAEADAELAAERLALGKARRRQAESYTGLFRAPPMATGRNRRPRSRAPACNWIRRARPRRRRGRRSTPRVKPSA